VAAGNGKSGRRRARLPQAPAGASVGLPERDLDAAGNVRDQVVDHRAHRGQRGDQDDVHGANEHRVAEHPGGGEPMAGLHARGLLAGRHVGDRSLDRRAFGCDERNASGTI